MALSSYGYMALLVLGFVAVLLALRFLVKRATRHDHPFTGPLKVLTNLVAPSLFVLLFVRTAGLQEESSLHKILETIFWISALNAGIAFLNAVLFSGVSQDTWRGRIPKLFIDVSRFFLVLLGTAFVLSLVWEADLGGVLAALGVGSIVLGLALQDTLGNLMSGIALLFEEPPRVGEWVRVGNTYGKVAEMNWRSLHLRTRANEMVVVPNSVIAKEIFSNYSKPSRVHAEFVEIGFSYNDPPHKVKRVLKEAADQTREILTKPEPLVRTKVYGDFAITYQVKIFLTNYDRLPDIKDDFMTRIWYAAKKNHLTIPFPIRTVYRTDVPLPPTPPPDQIEAHMEQSSLLRALRPEQRQELLLDLEPRKFEAGRHLVHQGQAQPSLYLILSGTVTLSTGQTTRREVGRVGPGESFGALSLLTGAIPPHDAVAGSDVEATVIHSEALRDLLRRDPDLSSRLAARIEAENPPELEAISTTPARVGGAPTNRAEALAKSIRRFYGL